MISWLVNANLLDAILRFLFVRKEEKSNASGADDDSGFFSVEDEFPDPKNFKILLNFEI